MSVAGRPRPPAKPAAVETTPSMPLAPRLAATGTRGPAVSANISMSRTGMLLPRKRPCPAGIARETMRAAAISPSGEAATKDSIAAAARSESARSGSPQAPAAAVSPLPMRAASSAQKRPIPPCTRSATRCSGSWRNG